MRLAEQATRPFSDNQRGHRRRRRTAQHRDARRIASVAGTTTRADFACNGRQCIATSTSQTPALPPTSLSKAIVTFARFAALKTGHALQQRMRQCCKTTLRKLAAVMRLRKHKIHRPPGDLPQNSIALPVWTIGRWDGPRRRRHGAARKRSVAAPSTARWAKRMGRRPGPVRKLLGAASMSGRAALMTAWPACPTGSAAGRRTKQRGAACMRAVAATIARVWAPMTMKHGLQRRVHGASMRLRSFCREFSASS